MGTQHRSRRIAGRLGVIMTAAALAFTVFASTVTAAPTLPGWVRLPLEASGMPHHLNAGLVDPDAPDVVPVRAEIAVDLATYAEENLLADGADLARGDDDAPAKIESDPFAEEVAEEVAEPEGSLEVLAGPPAPRQPAAAPVVTPEGQGDAYGDAAATEPEPEADAGAVHPLVSAGGAGEVSVVVLAQPQERHGGLEGAVQPPQGLFARHQYARPRMSEHVL